VIIGVSGYAQTGKDEISKIALEYGFERAAFADTLREALMALNPLIGVGVRVRDFVGLVGWEKAKRTSPELRYLLQRMGTEAGREIFGENIWVNKTLGGLDPAKNYIITDVRYKNEAAAIRDLGGQMWRVVRPGTGPVNKHKSEVDLDDYTFDFTIKNNGDLDNLEILVNRLFRGQGFTTERQRILAEMVQEAESEGLYDIETSALVSEQATS
jgi:hypothetical protein